MERLDELYDQLVIASKSHPKKARDLVHKAFPDKSPEPSLPHRYYFLIKAGLNGGVGLSANILKTVLEAILFKI